MDAGMKPAQGQGRRRCRLDQCGAIRAERVQHTQLSARRLGAEISCFAGITQRGEELPDLGSRPLLPGTEPATGEQYELPDRGLLCHSSLPSPAAVPEGSGASGRSVDAGPLAASSANAGLDPGDSPGAPEGNNDHCRTATLDLYDDGHSSTRLTKLEPPGPSSSDQRYDEDTRSRPDGSTWWVPVLANPVSPARNEMWTL